MSKYINCKHIVDISFYFSTESREIVTYKKGTLNSIFDIIFFGFYYFLNKKETIYRNVILSENYTALEVFNNLTYYHYVDYTDGVVKNYPHVYITLSNKDNYDIYFKNDIDAIKYKEFLMQKSNSDDSFIDMSSVLNRLN